MYEHFFLYPERDALRPLTETLFRLVAENASPKQWTDWLRPPVEHAAAQGNLDLVATLLQAGATATPGPRGCRGRSLLDAAAEGGNPEVVSALLRAGAKPEVSARSGSRRRSPLHRAAIGGHDAVSLRLMMAGANVSSLDADRRSPLHLAARAGHENVVGSLLLGLANLGVQSDVSARDKRGDAPLHLAASRGYTGIACVLVLRGAGKDARDGQGRTALHLAAENGHLNTVDALIDAGADPMLRYGENELSVLDSSASNGHVDVVRALLRHDAVDANDADSTGYTALHMAADNNAKGAIDALIESGADVDSLDIHHWTPLHCAARYNACCEAMHALQRRGANVHARETAGELPLHIASLYLADQAIDLLLRWGADETAMNEDGRIAADVIGIYAPDSDGSTPRGRAQRVNRIRRLLRGAPADRAWRRRGFIVLCRYRHRLSQGNTIATTAPGVTAATGENLNRAAVEDSDFCRLDNSCANKVPRIMVREEFGHHVEDAGDALASNTTVAGNGGGSCFDGVCRQLVGLAEEELFRYIVGFL